MITQKLPILLILMMLFAPIASAYDHCSGMGMTGHLTESQHLFDTTLEINEILVNQKQVFNSNTFHQIDMDCYASHSCTFHSSGVYGIASSVATVNRAISLYNLYFESPSFYATDLSPDLRPPIISL